MVPHSQELQTTCSRKQALAEVCHTSHQLLENTSAVALGMEERSDWHMSLLTPLPVAGTAISPLAGEMPYAGLPTGSP